jgi:nucleoside-diphosphate-sugar epimerase
VFNLAAPSPVSLVEGARYFAQALGEPYVELRVPQLERLEISTAKARALIGYRPQFDFQRMADSALAFARGEDIGVIYGTWPR